MAGESERADPPRPGTGNRLATSHHATATVPNPARRRFDGFLTQCRILLTDESLPRWKHSRNLGHLTLLAVGKWKQMIVRDEER